jgi:hypothetical protein
MSDSVKQTRAMSFMEATTNVCVGFAFALVTQFTIFPMLGLAVSVANNLIIGAIFTVISLLRSFTLRRLFEAVRVRDAIETEAANERS